MCVVSMIMDHYDDEWRRKYWPSTRPLQIPLPMPLPIPGPTPEELAEFRRLLERAREYDRKNYEPDCEMESKKRLLREMAAKLGVDISFIDDAPAAT